MINGRFVVGGVGGIVKVDSYPLSEEVFESLGRGARQRPYGLEAALLEELRGLRSDAVDFVDWKRGQEARRLLVFDDGKAVRFLKIGGDLRHDLVRSDPDGASQLLLSGNPRLEFECQGSAGLVVASGPLGDVEEGLVNPCLLQDVDLAPEGLHD